MSIRAHDERHVGRDRALHADGLGLGQRDVGDALGVQVEHAELDDLVDQRVDARQEQQLEREEREQHADRQLAGHRGARAEPDHRDVLEPEDQHVRRAMDDRDLLHADAGVDVLDDEVLVAEAPLLLAHVELDRHHPAQRLDEVRARLRFVRELLVGGAPLRVVDEPARRAVQQRGGEHDRRQRDAVEEHHAERQHDHQAVDDGLDERRRQRALDRVDAAEARDDVADVALLEPRERQADQLREQVGQHAHVDLRRQVDADPGAQRR